MAVNIFEKMKWLNTQKAEYVKIGSRILVVEVVSAVQK